MKRIHYGHVPSNYGKAFLGARAPLGFIQVKNNKNETYNRSARVQVRTIWDYLTLSGTIWHYLGLSGTIWHYLALSATIWHYLGQSGTIWDYLGLFATI